MAHWSRKYIQIKYNQKDCSAFVEFVLKDHFHIDYKFPQSRGNVFEQSNLIKKSIPEFANRTEKPIDGDLILMHGTRRLCHVGMYVKIGLETYVLHTESTMNCAALHRLKDLPSYGYTVEGFYSWLK